MDKYRNELMHLLIDVFVVDEEPDDRRGSNKQDMERPAEGKRYAGFRYFQKSILGFMKKPSSKTNNKKNPHIDESADLPF
jgi:plasmid rolling circle replication initiator protein Rep